MGAEGGPIVRQVERVCGRALTATVSQARGSKSESPLGGEVAQGTGAKPA